MSIILVMYLKITQEKYDRLYYNLFYKCPKEKHKNLLKYSIKITHNV